MSATLLERRMPAVPANRLPLLLGVLTELETVPLTPESFEAHKIRKIDENTVPVWSWVAKHVGEPLLAIFFSLWISSASLLVISHFSSSGFVAVTEVHSVIAFVFFTTGVLLFPLLCFTVKCDPGKWQRTTLRRYKAELPEFVRSTVEAVEAKLPGVRFYVEYYREDPFLVAELDGEPDSGGRSEEYAIEAWNEPDFSAQPLV